jgi:hypothetical protein
MVGDRVLDHLNELFLGGSGPDLVSMEKLDHQTGESLKGTWNSDSRADLDQHILSGLDVDLKLASLVDWRIEQSEQTLVRYVRPSLTDVSPHLPHYTNVVVAVEQVVLFLFAAGPSARANGRFIRFESCIAKDNDESLCIFVIVGDRNVLFGYQLW